MKNFSYYQPTTVEQAVGLLGETWGPAELLAGGTDLHDLQKEYVVQPEKLISLTILGGGFREISVSAEPWISGTRALTVSNAAEPRRERSRLRMETPYWKRSE